jgi:FtsP/CotA-like multicopper oxidase with cupredoxin domain
MIVHDAHPFQISIDSRYTARRRKVTMRKFIVVPALALMLAFALGNVEAQLECNLCDVPPTTWTEPPVISSQNGGFRTVMEVKFANNNLGSDTLKHRSYNGLLTGPTLRFKAGDTLSILLKNNLPVTTDRSKIFDLTNFHTHGLHVSPKCDPDNLTGPWNWCSDNVLIQIEPQTQVQLQFELPKDHPPGTHWYHPHKHGATAVQVTSGMSGALLLEGDVDEMLEQKGVPERLFVFQQIQYDKKTGTVATCFNPHNCELLSDDFGNDVDSKYTVNTSINGQLKPLIALQPGQVERWRFIHAGIKGALNVTLVPQKDGGCDAAYDDREELPLHEFAADGITMGWLAPRKIIAMFPGYRSDVLIQVNREGFYCLLDKESSDNTLDLFPGKREIRQVLAIVRVGGPRKRMVLPSSDDFKALAPYESLCDTQTKINTQQTMTFAEGWPSGSYPTNFFNVNGHMFQHDLSANPPRKLKLNNRDEWTLTTVVDSHPFHIHQNPFQVCSIEDKNQGGPAKYPDGTPVLDRPVWKDTIIVPHWQKITTRTHYKEFTGQFVLHCHILSHEDLGMMQLVEIVP